LHLFRATDFAIVIPVIKVALRKGELVGILIKVTEVILASQGKVVPLEYIFRG
jgi:hypothetical protein